MNTKDLMIGNWVYFTRNSQFPMQVVSIGDNYVYLDFEGNEGDVFEPTLEEMLPIEVTEEILTNNGFNKEERPYNPDEYYGIDACFSPIFKKWIGSKDYFVTIYENTNRIGGKHWCSIENYKKEDVGGFHFTYLHQLQNGIKLITGKDLEVKLWHS